MGTDKASVETILCDAIEIESDSDRAAFVERACAGDAALRHEVERLIARHQGAGNFLENRAGQMTQEAITLPVTDRPGQQIGPYKLRELLGEGGMGTVFVAEQQQPVRRKVAIKLIKLGMDSRQVVSRFESERHALALMDHPNIARVLDAGMTDNGRPYFVMEFVRGLPITDHCDQHKLGTRERLELFLQVCRAIQHAHQKGIIHRDLKPGNVLVAMHDTRPVVKVIDFGVAKAIGQSLTDKSIYTGVNDMVGTPLYMSPEQAGHSSLDVDTRSDVYSLGVLLYELLTGCTPFEKETLRQAGYDEIRRIIREVDPPRPSTRCSTLNAAALSTVAQCRQCEPHRLSQQLSGELDWIVMKAMEKDRLRRYESASHFAEDVERYLNDQPVEACPPSATYRLKKFATRNRTTLTTAIVVSVALIVGTALSLWQAVEATSARNLADERLINEQRSNAEAIEQRQKATENLRRALNAVDQMLVRVGDERLAALPGAESVRQELYRDAIRFYEAFFHQAPDDPQLQLSTAKAHMRLGSMHNFLSDFDRAQASREEAIRMLDVLAAQSPEDEQILVARAEAYTDFGICELWNRYKFASAESKLLRAVTLWQELIGQYPENLHYSWRRAQSELSVAEVYKNNQKQGLVESSLRHAVENLRQLWSRQPVSGVSHPVFCESLVSLAFLLSHDREHDEETESLCIEAIRCGEEVVAIAPESTWAVAILVASECLYGDFLKDRGRVVEAEAVFRKAVDTGEVLPRINPDDLHNGWRLPQVQMSLADLLVRDGKDAEALSLYLAAERTMQIAMRRPERFSFWENLHKKATDGLLKSLGHMVSSGHRDAAQKFCEELSVADTNKKATILDETLAARAWASIGELERGEQLLKEITASADGDGPEIWNAIERSQYGRALFTWADRDFHLRDYQSALPVFDLVLRCNPDDSESLDHRGQIYLSRGEPEKAQLDLDHALQHGRAYGALTYGHRARAHFRLGDYSRCLADLSQASQLDPHDARILSAIDPGEIAACPDEVFRRNYLSWFNQMMPALNHSSQARVARAALCTALQELDTVTDDLALVIADTNVSPDVLTRAGLVAIRLGDESRYREVCQLLAVRATSTANPLIDPWAVWMTVMKPQAVADYQPLVDAARRLVTDNPGTRPSLLVLGGVLFRAGQFEEALVHLNAVHVAPHADDVSVPYASFLLSMTHFQLGHQAEAQKWLAESVASTEPLLTPVGPKGGEPVAWNRRMNLELLRAESTALLGLPPASGAAPQP